MRHRYLFRTTYFYSDRLLDLKAALIRGSDESETLPPKRSFPAALDVLRETQGDDAAMKLLYQNAVKASNDLLFAGRNPLRVMKICAALLPRLPRQTNGGSNRFYAAAVSDLAHSLANCITAGDPLALAAIKELQTLQGTLDPQPLNFIFNRKSLASSSLLDDIKQTAQTSGFSDAERQTINDALTELAWESGTTQRKSTPAKPFLPT